MMSRLVLVFTLALLMVAAVCGWWLIALPRASQTSAAPQVDVAALLAEKDASAPRVDSPDQVLARLPAMALDRPQRDPAESAERPSREPKLLPAIEAPLPLAPESTASPSTVSRSPALDTKAGVPNRPASLSTPPATAPELAPSAATPADDDLLAWMRLLTDQRRASDAVAHLRARGFNASHIELARRFTNDDPAVRKAAIRSLTKIRGVTPADWLIWASRDPEPEVRRLAATLMITSSDPRLQAAVETMALQDPDAELRELARHGIDRLRGRN